MMDENLNDVLEGYTYLYNSKNEAFKKRMFGFVDEFKKVNNVKSKEVPVRQLINYMAVVDYENKIYFMGV